MKKYLRGEQIRSLGEVVARKFIIIHREGSTKDQIVHNGWFMSWQTRYLKRCIDQGIVYRAERNPDYPHWIKLYDCFGISECSRCGWKSVEPTPYCPQCGASMK